MVDRLDNKNYSLAAGSVALRLTGSVKGRAWTNLEGNSDRIDRGKNGSI